jgi:hypothetical protein
MRDEHVATIWVCKKCGSRHLGPDAPARCSDCRSVLLHEVDITERRRAENDNYAMTTLLVRAGYRVPDKIWRREGWQFSPNPRSGDK